MWYSCRISFLITDSVAHNGTERKNQQSEAAQWDPSPSPPFINPPYRKLGDFSSHASLLCLSCSQENIVYQVGSPSPKTWSLNWPTRSSQYSWQSEQWQLASSKIVSHLSPSIFIGPAGWILSLPRQDRDFSHLSWSVSGRDFQSLDIMTGYQGQSLSHGLHASEVVYEGWRLL